jgi:hypothetical protein
MGFGTRTANPPPTKPAEPVGRVSQSCFEKCLAAMPTICNAICAPAVGRDRRLAGEVSS